MAYFNLEAERVCTAMTQKIEGSAPPDCVGRGRDFSLRVLTRGGWLEIGPRASSDGKITIYCRFQIPHLARGLAPGMNPYSGKWNHGPLAPKDACARMAQLLESLWPAPSELPRLQFLGAIGDVFHARRDWFWGRTMFSPLSRRVRPQIVGLRQPGRYDVAGQFDAQDEEAFRAIENEFESKAAS